MLSRQFDDLRAASKAERHTLSVERDKLRDERRSLLHAHHAGTVPLDLLKEEEGVTHLIESNHLATLGLR